MTARVARAIPSQPVPPEAESEIARTRAAGFQIVTQACAEYPPLLLQIPDPPPFLYLYGRLQPADEHLAIIGSRNPTSYGLETARRLSAELTAAGLAIVSGMARGIDSAAHRGALEGGGRTVAVLGSGLKRIYPAENRRLYERIARQGAVISELPLDAGPDAHHFPARNRIISGMSRGTVVVEASLRSGSLITARQALEQNREIFAVPGSIRSFKSTGPHALIKQGAKLVENSRDVLEELFPDYRPPSRTPRSSAPVDPQEDLSAEQRQVLAAVETEPVHIDVLVRRLDMEPGRLSALLLELELQGRVRQAPGNRIYRAP